MKTNLLILLFISVATISCDDKSRKKQTGGQSTIRMNITTSSTVKANDIYYSDYLLRIGDSELEIDRNADSIVLKLTNGSGTVRILPQDIEVPVDDYQIDSPEHSAEDR